MPSPSRKARINPVQIAFTFCLSVLCIWLILAEMLVPWLLTDAYQGSGLQPLNRFFASRAFKKPLEYYLKLWSDFEFAIIISGLAYIIFIRCIQKKLAHHFNPNCNTLYRSTFSAPHRSIWPSSGLCRSYSDLERGDQWKQSLVDSA